MSVLDDIVAGVRIDLERRRAMTPAADLRAALADVDPPRDPMPHFRAAGSSVIAEVRAINNTAAAASLNFDNGFFADTECLTCSTGAGGVAAAGVSAGDLVDFSQNPELPAPTAGFVGCDAGDEAADCAADAGEAGGGDE